MICADDVHRKLTKRLEDLIQESTTLKAHLVPQMKALSNAVQEPVNFAINVCFSLYVVFFLEYLTDLNILAGSRNHAAP